MNQSLYKLFVPLAVIILLSAVLPIFASSSPDGLEWVAEKLHFAGAEASLNTIAFFADYTCTLTDINLINTAITGISGIALIGLFSTILFLILASASKKAEGQTE
jgi:hypothetical protein